MIPDTYPRGSNGSNGSNYKNSPNKGCILSLALCCFFWAGVILYFYFTYWS